MEKPTRKLKALPIAHKVKLIKAVENRGAKRKVDIAMEWGIPQSTLSTIMKEREKVLAQFENHAVTPARKRMRTVAYPDLEEALLMWFKGAHAENVLVSVPILQEKA